MPEETETVEQQESGTEETVEETGSEENGSEQQDDAQEAESGGKQEEPFDRRKFEVELRKKNSEASNLRKRLKELEPLAKKAKEFEDAQKSETERLNDQLTAANEQIAKTRTRLVEARVQALAGSPAGERAAFTDPEDALSSLDLGSYIDDSGDIDETAIEADLQALLERKPHWAKTAQPQEGPRRPAPDRTQASGANKKQAPSPRDEFAGWLSSKLT